MEQLVFQLPCGGSYLGNCSTNHFPNPKQVFSDVGWASIKEAHESSGGMLYDENNGLWYELQGEYYLTCLTLPREEEKPIGIWGQRHKRCLKEHRKATWLLTSGKLNTYLADISEQAQERFERLIEQMKQAQGITEQIKANNALEWVGRLNNIRACAMEIVEKEIIYA